MLVTCSFNSLPCFLFNIITATIFILRYPKRDMRETAEKCVQQQVNLRLNATL